MDSVTRILNIAENRMRRVGYNAVSFRDIATEMGIKSASLHYHFPKKADLGSALVQRYSENFDSALTNRTDHLTDPAKKITAFVSIYRAALGDQYLICLCVVLGSESQGLPESVTAEVRRFVTGHIDWLTTQYRTLGHATPKAKAQTTLALLQGAMILSQINGNMEPFDAAADQILAQLPSDGLGIGP